MHYEFTKLLKKQNKKTQQQQQQKPHWDGNICNQSTVGTIKYKNYNIE